jgi:hypothetical protein
MSTLTSLVKSGKRKIIKTKTGQPPAERERDSIKAQQKPAETSGSSASTKS